MIVARSAAPAAEARSLTTSSATDAPSAASISSPGALSPVSPAACPRPCPRPCRAPPGDRAGLDPPDVLQGAQPVAQPSDDRLVRRGLQEDGLGARVAHDPLDLVGRGRLVDRHGDRTGRPDRVVEDRPLVPRARHQAHPVTDGNPGRDQPLGQRRHLVAKFAGGDVLPGPGAGAAAQGDLLRLVSGAPGHDLGEIRRIRDLHESRDTVLAHHAVSLPGSLAAALNGIA